MDPPMIDGAAVPINDGADAEPAENVLSAAPTVAKNTTESTTATNDDAAVQARAKELVNHAITLAKSGRFLDAANALREATHLTPGNATVDAAWRFVAEEEKRSPLVDICRKWVESRDEKDGEEALKILKQAPVSADVATQCAAILMDLKDDEDDTADHVTGELLRNGAARKWLAEKLLASPTKTFTAMFDRGDDCADAIVVTCLDATSWSGEKKQTAAQRDVFQLALATMMKAGLDHPERAMRVIARLLAAEASHLNGIIDSDSFDVILSSLDIRLPNSLRSQATLATSKLLELSPDTAQNLITQFVTGRVRKPNTDALITAFSAAAAIFPITPSVAATLFLTEGFMSTFVNLVQEKKSQRLDQASLELLSAACVDKTCRESISKHCLHWIRGIAETAMDRRRSTLASLILVKITDEAQQGAKSPVEELEQPNPQDELVSRFKNIVLGSDNTMKQDSVEGLAYASLQPKIKEQLAKDQVFLGRLVETMCDPSSGKPIMFGGFTIFVNLTAYQPKQSEEEQKMSDLRAYANTQKPTKADPLDDDAHVARRCKAVLQSNIVPLLVTCAKKASPSVLSQQLQILLFLSKEPKHRATMAQQGAVKLLLQVWDVVHKELHPMPASYSPASNYACAHTLARILISVNPAHVFGTGSAIPATNAIRPLLSLLEDDPTTEKRDLLPTFESLLALTNLASMDDVTTRETILRLTFPILESNLFLHHNDMVRRAAVELLCNLMASPVCASKFADGSAAAANRLHILIALADVKDLATRRAASGALAMLTEWDEAVKGILARERGVDILLDNCKDESPEVVHRGVVCVRNLVGAPGEIGENGKAVVTKKGGLDVLKEVIKKSRDQAVLQVAVEALKILVEG